MDTQEAQNDITRYDEALENTPPAVRAFLWSDAFTAIVESIAKLLSLIPEQKEAVKSVLFDLTIGYMNETDARAALLAAGIAPELQNQIFQAGNEYIVAPAVELSEQALDEAAEEGSETAGSGAAPAKTPAPFAPKSDIMKDIQERFRIAASVAPAARNYTTEKTSTPNTDTTPAAPVFDPYREIPEK